MHAYRMFFCVFYCIYNKVVKRRGILERYNGLKLEWLHDSMWFIVIITIVFVLFRFVIGLSVVGGDSMYPTLQDGQLVLYTRIVREYVPGDVVTMHVPSGEYYVKRVIAAGGDVVDLRQGKVYVNGSDVQDQFGFGQTERATGAVIYPYTVRKGNVFVLGDNREVSMDSRTFGEVSYRQIRGKILYRIDYHGLHKVE